MKKLYTYILHESGQNGQLAADRLADSIDEIIEDLQPTQIIQLNLFTHTSVLGGTIIVFLTACVVIEGEEKSTC